MSNMAQTASHAARALHAAHAPQSNSDDAERSHKVIPAGAHTYSKGDDQFPANAPSHIESGSGVEVVARDGRKFLDWNMGLRSISLGYDIKPVNDAAIAQIAKGTNFGRPSFLETEYAEELLDFLPPYAEMVKYAKNGSNVTSAAVKLARAYTGRDMVALCKDHPFFSFDDWFIGTTPVDAGIPAADKTCSLTFPYGRIDAVEALFDAYPRKLACVIMEAATTAEPPAGYLERIRELCTRDGTVLIIDEMISGFRWHNQGASAHYGIEPDMSTFGKGMANGFSFSALVGRRDIMELGGIRSSKPRVFLLSGTHSAENHSIAAARATLNIFKTQPVIETMWKIGGAVIAGLNSAAREAGVPESRFKAAGVPCNPWYAFFEADGSASMTLRTLFLQEMIKHGVIIGYMAPSWSHKPEHVARTVEAARLSFKVVKQAIDDGSVSKLLVGPAVKPVFRKYNWCCGKQIRPGVFACSANGQAEPTPCKP
jgi:glutamate-1-semialdehyde 2,1-aminomutase